MPVELTQGCIQAIMRGENIDNPVVQLLSFKRISPDGNPERYRVIISDGIHFNSFAMLGTQFKEKIHNGELPIYTIVSLDHYVPTVLDSSKSGLQRRVIIILNMTILAKGDNVKMKIGSPVSYEDATNTSLPTTSTSPVTNDVHNGLVDNPRNIIPINGLNLYQNNWTIKARVISKTKVKTWSKAGSHGKVFDVNLNDTSGAIKATAFNADCDKFYDMIEVNKLYYIGGCSIKTANKKFTTIPHDYELSFNKDTQVELCTDDDSSIPQLSFNFTSLSALENVSTGSSIDVVGVCKSASGVQSLVTKSNRELKKREIILVDQTNSSVSVTIWDTLAEEFDSTSNPTMAIKDAKVIDFGGAKSLTVSPSSVVQINPNIPQAHELKGWFDSLDSHEFNNISFKASDATSGKLNTLKEAIENQFGTNKVDYFNTESIVLSIHSEKALYQACPTKDCKKKLLDQKNGMYRCEKCCQEFSNFEYRLMLNVQICDWTGNKWVSMFQDEAETLLGATATEIGNSRQVSTEDFDSYFHKPLFKTYMFRIRAKMDTFNNENKLKMSVVNVKPIDYQESCKRLISEIKDLSGVLIASH